MGFKKIVIIKEIINKMDETDGRLDSVVSAIILKFRHRALMGKMKYGTDLDRKDLSVSDWIQHAQEEHMDAILYLEKLKNEINNTNNTNEIKELVKELKEDKKEKEE